MDSQITTDEPLCTDVPPNTCSKSTVETVEKMSYLYDILRLIWTVRKASL